MASPRRAQLERAARGARRAWPFLMMAYERWQKHTQQQKERYIKQARRAAERARRGRGRG